MGIINGSLRRRLLYKFFNTAVNVVLMLMIFFLVNLASHSYVLGAEYQSTNSHSETLIHQIAPEEKYSGEFAEHLYAQVDEEVLVETESIDPSPNYKTGYYGTKDWQAFVAVYLWLVGMNGDLGVGNTTADVDVSFGDIWDNLDVGGQLHIEFWWKKWIFFVDPLFMKLSSSSSQTRIIGTRKADVEVKMFLMDLAMGYRVAEFALGPNTKSNNFKTWPAVAIDVYGGGRILSVDSTIDLTLDTPIGQKKQSIGVDEAWFDFIVGTRFIFDFTESLLLSVKTDIGGFGLGFSSDIDWNFVANLGYTLPWWGVTPYVGYRVHYVDYEDGSGDNRFKYDIWHTGPQIGIGVRF